jgi:Fibronectin type III domain/CARDB
MKKLLAILVLGLLTININCGGGSGGTSTSAAGKTTVTINLGETRTASRAGEGIVSASSIPSSVVSIRFVISAPDMATIERVVSVAGKTAISESFDIPNGANRDCVVEAMDASGNIVFRGETFANFDGRPVTLIIIMVSTDKTPPVFSGISSIGSITTTSMTLSWSAATDNVTPQGNIQYLIYMATTSGGENFATPSFTTTPGATSFNVPGLNPDTVYYFVVRAMDEAGNIDTNTVEMSARTLTPPDITPPVFGGLVSATATSSTSIDLQWNPASDNRSAPSAIVYLVYMSATSGGQNFAAPSFTTTAGATSFSVPGLTPNTTYYFVVRARDEAGNMDTNTVEKSAKTPIPPDTIPPTFGGLVSATATSSTVVALQWNAASDNITSAANIVYLVYMSTTSGGENLSVPNFTTLPGVTSYSVTGRSANTTYYFIVRAKDEAGNIDTNTVEKSATTPGVLADLQPESGAVIALHRIGYTVANSGGTDANNVAVWVWYGDAYENSACSLRIISVPAGGTFNESVGTFPIAPTTFTIVVNPDHAIPESNYTNNCYDGGSGGCSFPPASCGCVPLGSPCGSTTDCCSGVCFGGFCSAPG